MFKPQNFKNGKACVLGLGKSGQAVANLLNQKGFHVLISEEATINHIDSLSLPKEIEIETGFHSDKVFNCDFIVKSPGIFPKAEVLEKARVKNIPIFSELEVAISFLPKNVSIFAITGTNGKTTTTSLLGEILRVFVLEDDPSKKVYICGNIGNPVSRCISQIKEGDILVIEVSSYQLEDSTYFKPQYSCLLNITPDHLDHHGGMKNYIKAKTKIFKYQNGDDVLVVNGADFICADVSQKMKGKILAFSAYPKHLLKTDVFFDGDELIFSQGHQIRPPQLKGFHNVENAMAAALMALSFGVPASVISNVFKDFKPIEHRIEQFAYHKGVIYVNDSKATNLDSTITALKSFEKCKNIWLILGGRDKGASYEVLLPYLKIYCKKVLTIGESMDKIERELPNFPVTRCETLQHAVCLAMSQATKGDIVLLSPACSSFDQFKDYEERGKIFKQLVNAHIFEERVDK